MKAGDLVRLKSGGPLMTAQRVSKHTDSPFAACTWFDQLERPHTAYIKTVALKPSEPEKEPDEPG
jgi:uncharacterized protein YodC (DUF2158 family)